jgi:hypothetical protein
MTETRLVERQSHTVYQGSSAQATHKAASGVRNLSFSFMCPSCDVGETSKVLFLSLKSVVVALPRHENPSTNRPNRRRQSSA